MILLGIAFSLVPSAMWPSVPKIIPMKQLGTAYAIIFYIQNIGLSLVPVMIGSMIPENAVAGDYRVPMAIFAAFGFISIAVAMFLKRVDKRKGYGLELPNEKQ
jgi:sugar phosphate permease